MPALNYVGSLAQERMKFRSTTDVVIDNVNELFHAMSIYIPSRFADENIVGWDPSLLSPDQPAVFTAVVDNYVKVMKGKLLTEYQPVFRQDTNSAVIMYLIVFDDAQAQDWHVEDTDISYKPLTNAFLALYPFSYFKFMFDPDRDGRDVAVNAHPGTAPRMSVRLANTTNLGFKSEQTIRYVNTGITPVNLPDGLPIMYDSGSERYQWSTPTGAYATLGAAGNVVVATGNVGSKPTDDAGIAEGMDITSLFDPSTLLPPGVRAFTTNVQQPSGGAVTLVTFDIVLANASHDGTPVTVPSNYYDFTTGADSYSFGVVPGSLVINPSPNQFYEQDIMASKPGFDSGAVAGRDITGLIMQQPPNTTTPTGIPADVDVVIHTVIDQGANPGAGTPLTIVQGTIFNYNSGVKTYAIDVPVTITIPSGGVTGATVVSGNSVGIDGNIAVGDILDVPGSSMTPTAQRGMVIQCDTVWQGTDPIPSGTLLPSLFYDLSLALAVLCRNNISLSWFWTQINIKFVDKKPDPLNKCYIVNEKRDKQLAAVTSLLDPDARNKYYWASLYFLGCSNTCVIVHSEPINIISEILASWYVARNPSGTYIGNKLSLLRLSGTRIKPFGFPSWLDTSINENAADYHAQLRDMNVGYLYTIANNTPQESNLSMARGVGDIGGGIPVSMMMIAKFADYTCAQIAAKMLTDKGTATAPLKNDKDTYQMIQDIVTSTLQLFSGSDGRISNIDLMFPPFDVAKVSATAISAPNSWKARYTDSLDSIDVSGGIVMA